MVPITWCTVAQILTVSQNTRLIHSIVLWHIPVPTNGFITTTGSVLRPARSYDHDRLRPAGPTTGYDRLGLRPAGWNPSEYTENTRSCIMTSSGHDRWLYRRPTQVLGLRSTGVGIWYDDHGRALPTVRIIVPSSPRVSVGPNTTALAISEWYVVTGHSLIERVTIFLYLTVYEHNWFLHVIHFKST